MQLDRQAQMGVLRQKLLNKQAKIPWIPDQLEGIISNHHLWA